jgi:hypothetical protein
VAFRKDYWIAPLSTVEEQVIYVKPTTFLEATRNQTMALISAISPLVSALRFLA